MSVDVSHYVALAAVMFFIGVAGVLLRRNPLILRFSDGGLYVWIAAAKSDPRKQGRELYRVRYH